MDIREQKKALRRSLLERRTALTADFTKTASGKICENILKLIARTETDTVLLFYPIKNEPDLCSLVKVLCENGIRVGFPISRTEDVSLDFRAVSDVDDMRVGAYGIREPREDALAVPVSSRSLCIVPALAYDKCGHRLGYGKGYYDRFLADFPGVSAGAVYGELVLDLLPADSYDVRVNMIITEGGVVLPDEVNKANIHPEAEG